MSEPFIGEITLFAGNFAPRGWALCDGQTLSIAQNSALYSLFGTIYGGDGRTTFSLPDLRGRAPMHAGRGPGLTERRLGERRGDRTVALSAAQLPAHAHGVTASNAPADSPNPVGRYPANTGGSNRYAASSDLGEMADLQPVGRSSGALPHANQQPYLAVNYIVALVGVYPSPN